MSEEGAGSRNKSGHCRVQVRFDVSFNEVYMYLDIRAGLQVNV